MTAQNVATTAATPATLTRAATAHKSVFLPTNVIMKMAVKNAQRAGKTNRIAIQVGGMMIYNSPRLI